MSSLSTEEFDTAFGLHSGYPQCCVWARNEGKIPNGNCERCETKGLDSHKNLHHCSWDNINCLTYLQIIEDSWLQKLPSVLDDQDFYFLMYRKPVPDEAIEIIHKAGLILSHSCQPCDKGYWYIWQKPGCKPRAIIDAKITEEIEHYTNHCPKCGKFHSIEI